MRDRTDLFPVEISETLPEQRLNIESIDGMDIEFVDPEGGLGCEILRCIRDRLLNPTTIRAAAAQVR